MSVKVARHAEREAGRAEGAAVLPRSRFAFAALLAAAVLCDGSMASAAEAPSIATAVERSVVRVQVFRTRWDWTMPWRAQPVSSGLGSGFLVAGGRILTNAHVVADARQILIKRHDGADPFPAEVVAVGHDCDLALLEVKDPAFHKGLEPLALGKLPPARSRVTTYGFPLGGEQVSSTEGIVSRFEWRSYVHSGYDWHLVAQTDAAINPGNSGGPVVHAGKVVGVAFQGIAGFDNLGFFVPAPVVQHFLDDLADGRYDGFPDAGFRTVELISPAYRRERGLSPGQTGVVVDAMLPGGTGEGLLRAGDVILAVEGHPLADDGSIALFGVGASPAGGKGRQGFQGARVPFAHLVDMKQIGQPVRFRVWREGKEVEIAAPAKRIARGDRSRNSYDKQPRYLVYAGLVFMPLDVEYLKTFGQDWRGVADRELVWHHVYREWEKPEDADREVVVLARVLRHPVNSQLRFASGGVIIGKVNGRPIRGLADVAEALEHPIGKFHLIEEESWSGGVEALDREKADQAHEEILKTYGIPRDRNL